ncbi:MAG: hypothetical protein H6872_13165 [Methylobacteriaceae bacterium]|nr:hypothetical protein [Methylobacteriaceae bacterium]
MTISQAEVNRLIAGRARLGELAALFSPGVEAPAPLSPRARKALRERLFAERPFDTLKRMWRAARVVLPRDGLTGCLRATGFMLREKSIGAEGLPDPGRALLSPEGLCGVADELSVATIMDAYERGLYPSGHLGPMKWWSPALRAIATPQMLTSRQGAASGGLRIAFDQNFEAALCEADRAQPTPPRLKWAFAELFDAGFAHAFDISLMSGERVAGGYGVAVGRVFVIEALHFRDPSARAACLAALAGALEGRGFQWIDAKRLTPELAADGFDGASRMDYLARLKRALAVEQIGAWSAPPIKDAA